MYFRDVINKLLGYAWHYACAHIGELTYRIESDLRTPCLAYARRTRTGNCPTDRIFFFFPRNQIFLLLSIHSISSIIVVSNNTPTHRSIRYREIDRCRNSGNTVISVIGRAYRTRLFIYIYIRISTRYRPPPRFLDRSARFVFFARARRTIN